MAFRARRLVEQHRRFMKVFEHCKENFTIERNSYFQGKLLDLQNKFSRWNSRKIDERAKYLDAFSSTSWTNLPLSMKAEHALTNCKGCAKRYSFEQSLFPVKSKQFSTTTSTQSAMLLDARNTASTIISRQSTSGKQDAVLTARSLYNDINPKFQSTYNVSLSTALTKVQELKLEHRKSKTEKKKERRNCYRMAKLNVEAQWKKTEVVRQV